MPEKCNVGFKKETYVFSIENMVGNNNGSIVYLKTY